MVAPSFAFARTPTIHFGVGSFSCLEKLISPQAKNILAVTGTHSFITSKQWNTFNEICDKLSVTLHHCTLTGEPTTDYIDDITAKYKDCAIDLVIAIGGGSVIDAGKAISAMLTQDTPVIEYLEDVGTGKIHNGKKIPFIAVPTTAGTGSEATKNAVLGNIGKNGFKKSLRHDNFVPDVAIVDPELTLSCPKKITAVCGMDAMTQLLESYVSSKANPMTDALAMSGLEYIKDSLVPACEEGCEDINCRTAMAYASHLSGITLANAGLGTVHGLASSIGGRIQMPHGAICGTMVAAVTEATIDRLKSSKRKGKAALHKYANVGRLFTDNKKKNVNYNLEILKAKLWEWTEKLSMPTLSQYGMPSDAIEVIAQLTGNKNNPIPLDTDEIQNIIRKRM